MAILKSEKREWENMLKKLKAKNYKCWKDLEIEFSPKITAITGLSYHGKTSILNAIKLLSTLRPNGANYISDFAKDKKTDISLEFQNGKVDFQKTKTKAQYILNEDKKNPFTHLNKNVPNEISDFIKIDDDNFSLQFDGPYLIFSPNSTISKKINESIGIEKWDQRLKEINKELTQTKRSIKEEYKKVKSKKRCLKTINKLGYKELESLIKEEEQLNIELLKNTEKFNEISEINQRLKDSNLKKINDLILCTEIYLALIDKLYEKIDKNKNAYLHIQKLKSIKKSSIIFERIESKEKILDSTKDRIEEIEKRIKDRNEIIYLIEEIRSKKKESIKAQVKIEKTKIKINKIEVCPECGQSLTKI